ncbi:MAG: cytochrome P450 [Frankia sp.]|nr:cytochrome P450 [Frankia sp.]
MSLTDLSTPPAPASDAQAVLDSATWAAAVPHEAFKRLRAAGRPVQATAPDERRVWMLVRHADIYAASRNPAIFSNRPDPFTVRRVSEEDGARPTDDGLPLLISLDPPEHTRLRQLLNRGFTPRSVLRLKDRVQEIVNDRLAGIRQRPGFDFVSDVAVELPLQVIADLLGIPEPDRHQVFAWTERMMSGDDPELGNDPKATMAALAEMYAYSESLCSARREQPGGDLMSQLLDSEVDGRRLSQFDLNLFFLLLHNAGSETTRNLLTGGVLALLEHPDQLDLLRADPSLVPTAVEELLRWITPVSHFARTVTTDTVVAGQPVRAGERVVLWYTSANRDEEVFTSPDVLDVTRSPNPHVAFGAGGPHFCLGAHLARLEGQLMFLALLELLPNLELAGPPARLKSHFISGIKRLPLRWRG